MFWGIHAMFSRLECEMMGHRTFLWIEMTGVFLVGKMPRDVRPGDHYAYKKTRSLANEISKWSLNGEGVSQAARTKSAVLII